MRNYHGVGSSRHILRISGLERLYHIKIETGALVRVSPCRCRPITMSIKRIYVTVVRKQRGLVDAPRVESDKKKWPLRRK